MTNLEFPELDNCYRRNDFPSIENDSRGIRFLKLRSLSRKVIMEELFQSYGIPLPEVHSREYFKYLFEFENLREDQIDDFIRYKYRQERSLRVENQDYLVDQLNRLQYFDWGGSFGNSLEKNIVNNYVKQIQSFQRINDEIEGRLLNSLRGYTLNSWYNHWTSILIEDLFKDHENVLPAVGLVKKIDFFIHDIPFDLKVTYFPEQLMKTKFRQNDFGNELTRIKRVCRELKIYIPTDLKDKALTHHLYNILSEDSRGPAQNIISELKDQKRMIIEEAEQNPSELKKWFYENQGEARFDASNRFFLVLTDEEDMANSWKLKRNILFLRDRIHTHLDSISMNISSLETEFFWRGDSNTYQCKSDILFLKYRH